MAYEDAQTAWKWLAAQHGQRERFVFRPSLGAPYIDLASRVEDERGVIVEAPSLHPDVAFDEVRLAADLAR